MPKYYHITAVYKKAVLKALGKDATKKGEVNIIFTNDKEILRINKHFINHHYVTDVISFNYPFTGAEDEPFGDVFVCFPQAKKQAKEQGHPALLETLILALHGTLHLIGYDDNTTELRTAMNAKAEQIAKSFLYAN